MVVKLVILYPSPEDAQSFEAAYVGEHLPSLLETLPGVLRCALSKAIWSWTEELPFHLMAELYFPSLEALQTSLPVDVVQEIGAHMALFAGDATVSVVCMEEVVPGTLAHDQEAKRCTG